MTIELKPEQERIIHEEIRNGHFRNADEVLDHALAALLEKNSSLKSEPKPRKNLAQFLMEDLVYPALSLIDSSKISVFADNP